MRTAWHGRHHATGFCHLFTQGGVHSRYKKMKRERTREKNQFIDIFEMSALKTACQLCENSEK